MKKTLAIILSLAICLLSGCRPVGDSPAATEASMQVPPSQETTAPTVPEETDSSSTVETTQPTEETVSQETAPFVSEESVQETTVPQETQPKETRPKETVPPATEETNPPSTDPPETEPTEAATTDTVPPATEPPATEAETEPDVIIPDYAFKRQVAAYAAQYINQYRSSPCTVLSGMSQVAQYRAGQLCYNFSHSTSDKRAALAHYEYGRWIDATEAGLDASLSYYESDTAEAICRGFRGSDAEALGKAIADLIRSSGNHWSYVGSSEYSYMGVGVEYREDSYNWYCCVMVGTVDYG